MSLTLHFHPLASFCQKALIALYENDTPFAPRVVDLSNEAERAGLTVIMNRCPKIEYGRLSGEIGWYGVNRRTIDNRKPAARIVWRM